MWWNNGTNVRLYGLFIPSVPTNKINTFACGHVIPKENLQVFPISQWNDTNFEFLFQKRNDSKQLMALGEFLIEITKRVPYGVVIFFPSYKYLDQVLQFWRDTKILTSIESEKRYLENLKIHLMLKKY